MNSAAVISQACPDCKGKGWIEMKCLPASREPVRVSS